MKSTIFLLQTFYLSTTFYSCSQTQPVDVLVYGATSTGVTAAVAARRLNRAVRLIEPGYRVGGLTSGGLGQTDTGLTDAITGMAKEFYWRLGKYYQRDKPVYAFEPKAALKVFHDLLGEVNLTVNYGFRIKSVKVNGRRIKKVVFEDKENKSRLLNVKAEMFIDATYEGDLMALANVSFAIGRESNSIYNETYNGVQYMERDIDQFDEKTDPFKIKGQPSSGLLFGISNNKLEANGTGDNKTQSYAFRVCLTKDPKNRINFTRPKDYDATKYELLVRYLENKPSVSNISDFLGFGYWNLVIPNDKVDINNKGPFSTDLVGFNYDYPLGNWTVRARIHSQHLSYTKGLFYFIATSPLIKPELRHQMRQWGYPRDEYLDSDHFSPTLYVREARRMLGRYIMTEHEAYGRVRVSDGIALASYNLDSRNVQRLVIRNKIGHWIVKNEGHITPQLPGPYNISYRAMLPKNLVNLLVPTCLSASHTCYGSIRMEPVFMALGQAAGTAAAMAVGQRDKDLGRVDVEKIQKIVFGK